MSGETLSPLEKAKSNLELILKKNAEFYHELSDTDEALIISDLMMSERGIEITHSDEFKRLVAAVGWPNKQDRASMTWSLSFHDSPDADEAFADAYFAATNPINNAKDYILTESYSIEDFPIDPTAPGGMTRYLYGSTPFRMRAELVAPELFEGLREFHEAAGGRMQAYAYLEQNHDETVMHAMRVAYTLLGRCMRSDDQLTHHKMLFGTDETAERIVNISDALST